jgi:hypothetical protein
MRSSQKSKATGGGNIRQKYRDITAIVLGIVVGIVVSFVVIVAPAYHIFSRKPSESFTIMVSPRSLSVARGSSGTLTFTVSPPEYGSFITVEDLGISTPKEVESFGEVEYSLKHIGPNSFAYTFDIENNAPPGTYTFTLTVWTYVSNPPLAASENFVLTVT